MDNVRLSCVTTLFRSREFLPEFVERMVAAAAKITDDYELILVDDGSPDDAREIAVSLQKKHPAIRVIELSRNFGHHAAALCGLQNARGEYVYITDCDLEVAPECLLQFMEELTSSNADVVYGYQGDRAGPAVARMGGGLFWKLFNKLSDTKVPVNIVTERLLTRRYVDELVRLGDRNIFLGGMMYWVGFRQIGMPVIKQPRKSRASYRFFHRFSLVVEAITSFSNRPLSLMFGAGLAISLFSILSVTYLVVRKLLFPESVLDGFTTVVAVLGISIGLNLFSIGTVGIYVGKIFKQVQDRPRYIIRRFHEAE